MFQGVLGASSATGGVGGMRQEIVTGAGVGGGGATAVSPASV